MQIYGLLLVSCWKVFAVHSHIILIIPIAKLHIVYRYFIMFVLLCNHKHFLPHSNSWLARHVKMKCRRQSHRRIFKFKYITFEGMTKLSVHFGLQEGQRFHHSKKSSFLRTKILRYMARDQHYWKTRRDWIGHVVYSKCVPFLLPITYLFFIFIKFCHHIVKIQNYTGEKLL